MLAEELSEEEKDYIRLSPWGQGLDDRGKVILEARCFGTVQKTLVELAGEFKVSDARIRQLEQRLRKQITALARKERDDERSPLGQRYNRIKLKEKDGEIEDDIFEAEQSGVAPPKGTFRDRLLPKLYDNHGYKKR